MNARAIMQKLKEAGISVPEDFMEQVQIAKRYEKERDLRERDVEQVIKIADFWKPALKHEEDYSKLAVYLVYKMYKIHCCALTTMPECKYTISDLFEVNEDCPLIQSGRPITTILSIGGNATVKGWKRQPEK